MDDAADSLKCREEQTRRRALLGSAPHMQPLLPLLQALRQRRGKKAVPAFDPLDGGADAAVLFLLETPGQRAVESGFISRNNPDPSARHMLSMLQEARLPRQATLLWNVVPWHLNGREPRRSDLAKARKWLEKLLACLPHLEYVVLVGGHAHSMHIWLSTRTQAHILACHHPSGRSLNLDPERRSQNIEVFAYISRRLTNSMQPAGGLRTATGSQRSAHG